MTKKRCSDGQWSKAFQVKANSHSIKNLSAEDLHRTLRSLHVDTIIHSDVVLNVAEVKRVLESDLISVSTLDADAARTPRSPKKLLRPPANRMVELLRWVMPRRSFERIFAQLIADFREEYFDDLAMGRNRKAQWRHVMFYGEIIVTVAAWAGDLVVNGWKAFRRQKG